jgi:Domain of unknown function (DUF4249)
MNKKIFIVICGAAFFLSSCEKGITFDLDEKEPKLVVEATIENGQAPLVLLSKSFNFFETFGLRELAGIGARGAEVYISDGVQTLKLKEYGQPIPGTTDSIFYFTNDIALLPAAIIGAENKSYSLRIVWNGKEYKANTTIPVITRRIDSLFWKKAPEGNDTDKVALMVKATDKPGYGDYIRYFTKSNKEDFQPGLNSVFDDQIIDGTTYTIEVERGVNRSIPRKDGFGFFNKGDTVSLKLCNIDKANYDFWRTVEFSYASIGNPFSTPTKVSGNISNGALGYFGGYGAQFKTIIIPK